MTYYFKVDGKWLKGNHPKLRVPERRPLSISFYGTLRPPDADNMPPVHEYDFDIITNADVNFNEMLDVGVRIVTLGGQVRRFICRAHRDALADDLVLDYLVNEARRGIDLV
jgi:hypothetical protein